MNKRYDKQFKEEAVRLSDEIGVKQAVEQLETPGFTEVKLLETPGQDAVTEPPQSGQIRIEAGGIQITANGGYPVEKLSALLMAVKQL